MVNQSTHASVWTNHFDLPFELCCSCWERRSSLKAEFYELLCCLRKKAILIVSGNHVSSAQPFSWWPCWGFIVFLLHGCRDLCACGLVWVSYPEALEVARLQQVPQIEDLSDGPLLLLRHSSQGNAPLTPTQSQAPPPAPPWSVYTEPCTKIL